MNSTVRPLLSTPSSTAALARGHPHGPANLVSPSSAPFRGSSPGTNRGFTSRAGLALGLRGHRFHRTNSPNCAKTFARSRSSTTSSPTSNRASRVPTSISCRDWVRCASSKATTPRKPEWALVVLEPASKSVSTVAADVRRRIPRPFQSSASLPRRLRAESATIASNQWRAISGQQFTPGPTTSTPID